uniref:Putative 5'-nucleotidase/apyrase n=1 Tax=Ixodes ricinus TaxID=34613 RepID=A0A0K8RC96_IXORI
MKCFYLAAFLAISQAAPRRTEDEGFTITVLHTNDIHSHFLQSDKRGGNCTEEKAKNNVMLRRRSENSHEGERNKGNEKNTFFFNDWRISIKEQSGILFCKYNIRVCGNGKQ